MLNNVKLSLRIATDAFDNEISVLISAALLDLQIAGITVDESDALIQMAVTTFVKMRFGNPDNYDKLKASYDEQKAQLQMSSRYVSWSD